MALVRLNSRRFMDPFSDFDRVFDTVTPSWFTGARRESWVPAIEVYESANSLEVTAELPGMREEDIAVNIQDNVLTVSGEKRAERTENDEHANIYYAERRYGKFERAVTLPSYVNADEADATFKNGVLSIRLPKAEQHRQKAITIKS